MNYKVIKAIGEQLDWHIAKYFKKSEDIKKHSDDRIGFFAVTEDKNILGYLVISIKEVTPPFCIDWFIQDTRVLPEFRRQGIATAILGKTIKYAKEANVNHLIGMSNKEDANLFWYKNDFGFYFMGKDADGRGVYGITRCIVKISNH